MGEQLETVDTHEAAKLLRCDSDTVAELANRGELAGTKIGRSWVFVRADLIEWLRQRIAAETTARRSKGVSPAMPVKVPASKKDGVRRRRQLPDLDKCEAAGGVQ